MVYLSEHNRDCKRLLGKAWQKVHIFLDQYADIFNTRHFNMYHRTFLHNKYGLEIVRAMWGEQAYTAAIIHLVRDSWGMPIDSKNLDFIKSEIGKTLIYFNDMNQFKPRMSPLIVKAWKGESLVSISRIGDE